MPGTALGIVHWWSQYSQQPGDYEVYLTNIEPEDKQPSFHNVTLWSGNKVEECPT